MAYIGGKYSHEKNENLDLYFSTIGVPYIPRKMMLTSKPSLQIYVNPEEEWTIVTYSLLRTTVLRFKLGEEYEENMPGGVIIKSTTVLEGDKLVTISIGPNDNKICRTYEFTETHCIITMKHELSGVEAKRYFKRAVG